MKTIINSLFISLSMYSVFPAPLRAWEKNNMKYVMAFMPLVGLFTGFMLKLWVDFLNFQPMNSLFFAAIATIIPIFITGGLHLDGYLDTCDAIGSHADMEKKLEILKDPRTGAFSVIYTAVYFALSLGFWSQFSENPINSWVFPLIFCLSRAISALYVVSLEPARSSGLVYLFNDGADKKHCSNLLTLEILLLLALIFKESTLIFALIFGIFTLLTIWFIRFTKKIFGGITGDLIGFFITISELIMVFVLTLLTMWR